MIIFSCNGVLIDSMRIVADTVARMFADSGVSLNAVTYEKLSDGQCVARVCREYESRTGHNFKPSFASHAYSGIIHRFETELHAVPHIGYALSWLRDPKCVFSEWPKDVIRAGLESAGLAHFFARHRVVSFHDTGFEQPFFVLGKMLGIAPSRCILVCRSPATIARATRSGLQTIGFAGHAEHSEEHERHLLAAGATAVITDMRQLKQTVVDLQQPHHTRMQAASAGWC